MVRLLCACLIASLVAATHAKEGAPWPEFRGPGGQGVVTAELPTLAWSEAEHVRWRSELPGRGWSSPVVGETLIWLTTAVEQFAPEVKETNRKGGLSADQFTLPAAVEMRALAVDRKTGQLVHNVLLRKVDELESIHTLNSYASPSPVLDGDRLYCNFGRYGTYCIDTTTQRVVWERQIDFLHYVGPGSSPVLVDGKLVLTCDGADQQFVTALDAATGEIAWKTDRPPQRATDGDLRKSYCTPLVLELGGRTQVVVPGAQWVVAYDPQSGSELWRHDHGDGFSLVPRPVSDGEHLYCCTGYPRPKLLAFKTNGQSVPTIDWEHEAQVPAQPSPVLVAGKLLTVSDAGIAQCLDAKTGKLIWKRRLPGNYSASPLAVGGHVLFCSREGVTSVVANDEDGTVVAENQLPGQIMASPVLIDGDLLLRTDTALFAISK